MKIHVDEQTVEVEAGRISIVFNLVEDMPDETNTETVEPVVDTPTDGSNGNSDQAAQVPEVEATTDDSVVG